MGENNGDKMDGSDEVKTPEVVNGSRGRNPSNGRFMKGHKFGTGRPRGIISNVQFLKDVINDYPTYSYRKEQISRSYARRIAMELHPDPKKRLPIELSKALLNKVLPDRLQVEGMQQQVLNVLIDGKSIDLSKLLGDYESEGGGVSEEKTDYLPYDGDVVPTTPDPEEDN